MELELTTSLFMGNYKLRITVYIYDVIDYLNIMLLNDTCDLYIYNFMFETLGKVRLGIWEYTISIKSCVQYFQVPYY